jgi:hypothetical protein
VLVVEELEDEELHCALDVSPLLAGEGGAELSDAVRELLVGVVEALGGGGGEGEGGE